MLSVTNQLAAEYERIQKRAKEDPGTAGDQGEENWATVLRHWLPPVLQVATKGRILSIEGRASPQLDVIVLSPVYPKVLLDKKLYLAGGVLAAFECKTTLRSDHIEKAVETGSVVHSLTRLRTGTPYKELHSPIIYGLLAHSHNWKRKGSNAIPSIIAKLTAEDQKQVKMPRNMLDILCVADLATWTAVKHPCGLKSNEACATSCFIGHDRREPQYEGFTPVGSMLSYLVKRLAWEMESLRPLAEYFQATHLEGAGSGGSRYWNSSVYSEHTQSQLKAKGVSKEVSWDEWSDWFP
jgi:hypothetical protein